MRSKAIWPALLLLAVAGCSFLALAQAELAKYSVESEAKGAAYLAGNAKFLVYHANGRAWAKLRGPRTYGGPIEVLWEWSWSPENQSGVYQLIVPTAKGEEFQLVESTWAAARVSLKFLPEAPPWEAE